MGKIARYTYLALWLNLLLDLGSSLDPEDVFRAVEEHATFEFLERQFGDVIDLSPLLRAPDLMAEMNERFERVHNASDNLLAEKNGIACLLSYCLEAIQLVDAGDV